MHLPWEIFRAYDIRGRALGADAPLTAPLAEAIGRAYGTMLRREWTAAQCLIGGDHRVTTPALSAALIEGLRGAGIDVLNIGLAASPLAYWAAAQRCEAERPPPPPSSPHPTIHPTRTGSSSSGPPRCRCCPIRSAESRS